MKDNGGTLQKVIEVKNLTLPLRKESIAGKLAKTCEENKKCSAKQNINYGDKNR